ncbi:hypothetical protein RND81_12G202700 [Saponaria officinalis]|uniref:Bifunctional inhibitor/plant lipid transfer protein/seed storage helical domain-containing protein n=1 Tax=Saponaria officinalis TaxID=3572 RepID=A0AAW1HD29_SAPOF
MASLNKSVIIAAIVAAMAVLIQATYLTTEMGTSTGRCRHQMRGGERPENCEKFMRESMRGMLKGRSHFDECCEELMMMEDPHCQCDAMKNMMMGMMGESMMMTMMEKAMMMPMMCGTMQRRCSMSSM